MNLALPGCSLPFALFCLLLIRSAIAGPGDRDPTFGLGGAAVMPFPPAFRSLQSLAVQSDGRLVGAGQADNISSSIGIVRWLATGAVDSGFGGGASPLWL